MTDMKFTKMHGIGNCYVFVNCFDQQAANAPALAMAMSDRNTGVGSDGLVLICPSEVAAARMEMYNLDGSRAQMCGNAIRCLAKYVYDRGLSTSNPMQIETDAGVLTLELSIRAGKVQMVCVDMGEPRLAPDDLPVRLTPDQMVDYSIEFLGRPVEMTCVSMGNPHAVLYGVPLEILTPRVLAEEGSRLERHRLFPERTNVHFVRVDQPDEVTMRTWERGSGATQACGTGASAVCVAGVLTKRSARRIVAHLPGGDLTLEWRASDNHVSMTGPAAEIFTGDWPDG